MARGWRCFAIVGVIATLAACQNAPQHPALAPAPPPAVAAPQAAAPPDFAAWLDGIRAEAARRGISQATIDAALTGLVPIPRVIDLDHRQAEFSQTFWHYMD